jgi:hypothetical protein
MKIFLHLLFLSCFLHATAQDDCLWDIVSTAGGNQQVIAEGVYFNWTIGEPVIATLTSASENVLMTQGFQQPDYTPGGCIMVHTTDIGNPAFELQLFPNPVQSELTISSREAIPYDVHITCINLLGQMIFESQLSTGELQIKKDVSELSSGVYMVRFDIPGIKWVKTYKIIKIK